MKRFFKIALPICAIIFAIVGTIALLLWNGIIWFNNPSNKDYPIRGVDVSHYQGDIDWAALSSQDIEFAFIKATEGSSYVDEYFDYNFKQAQASGIDAGAYHFFSYDSAGLTQAENFIRTVTPFEGREQTRIESAAILMMMPSSEIMMISSSRSTTLIAATIP